MHVLKLPPHRWPEMKQLRLEALLTDPEAFGSTVATTETKPDEWWEARLQTALVDSTRTVLFAEEDGRLIGMAGAYPESDPGFVDIVSMYVAPAYRGRGVGEALLQGVIGEIQGPGIRLCVNAGQIAAIRLYERFGFVTIAETPLCRADGSEYVQLFMERLR